MKIRGQKRRQKDLDKWIDFNKDLDLYCLNNYGCYYAKAKFGPWANLFNERPYPTEYKRQLFSNLIKFYFGWKKQLEKNYDRYYLKIWIYSPRFINSQIVAAVGDKVDYYENLFEKSDKNLAFPMLEFNNETELIQQFNWSLNKDCDYHLESEFSESKLEDFMSAEDYYHEQKFYKKLIKNNTPFKLIQNENQKEEKLFSIEKGNIWIGEINEKLALTTPIK